MKITELSNTQTVISLKGKTITLLGTAHISQESTEEVISFIENKKPDAICVELDEGRYKTISEGQNWQQMNIAKILREKKGFLLIANLILSSFQKRMGIDVGSKPGQEMISAIECAKNNNIPFTLCDRNIHTTLRRAWANSNFIGKCKLLSALFGSLFSKEDLSKEDLEKLKEKTALSAMLEELSQYLPTVKKVLIDERDQYLATNIFKTEGKNILAVVGAGHVKGLVSHIQLLNDGTEQITEIEHLNIIPKKRWWAKAFHFIIPTLIIGAFCYGWIVFGFKGFAKLSATWIFWNALLSGVGALIALGNPLSILVAAISAPITSLGLPISSGILAGIVESLIRKPKVQDVTNISQDMMSIKGVYKNRITRALLLFFLASLGSAIGTWVAGANIAINIFSH